MLVVILVSDVVYQVFPFDYFLNKNVDHVIISSHLSYQSVYCYCQGSLYINVECSFILRS